jgi:DNA-binding LytR/AlgR family response regulator
LTALRSERARELAIMLGLGIFLAAIGAFDTEGTSLGARLAYWLTLLLAGWLVHAVIESWLSRQHFPGGIWLRGLVLALAMTLPLTPLVWLASSVVFGAALDAPRLLELAPGVGIVCLAVVALLGVAQPVANKNATTSSTLPEALRDQLPLALQTATLRALHAEDHYVRVHTSAGSALIRARLSDAEGWLDEAEGFRTHRSWWVAAGAVRDVRWRRGSALLRLDGGLEVPVSRAFARTLALAGRI